MTLQWKFANDLIRLAGNLPKASAAPSRKSHSTAIGSDDARRQESTAAGILEKLNDQPGIVLADEVGMGKTYVALAVVASVLQAERKRGRPIVVMMPPGLATKWQNEWLQFKTLCCREGSFDWVRSAYARNPGDFFKLIDDSGTSRKHLIFVTTSCFHQGFSDRWMKLAFIRGARSQTRMTDEMKTRLYRWATTLVRLKEKQLSEALIERLMVSKLQDWKQILVRETFLADGDDDPIPEQLIRHIDSLDFREIANVIKGEGLPWRTSSGVDKRLRDIRQDFNEACDRVYREWLRKADWQAPLLVLDEAHHAKNDGTRLAGLFRSTETTELLDGSDPQNRPILWGKFDRMLFLTATPFQLGHHELIRILRSFGAAHWKRERAPTKSREEFQKSMGVLSNRLDVNRQYGKRLDDWWGQLKRERFGADLDDQQLNDAVLVWWKQIQTNPTDALETQLVQAVNDSVFSRTMTENDLEKPWQSLRAWVIRHNRLPHLPRSEGQPDVLRRLKMVGSAISVEETGSRSQVGLPLSQGTALPFLLAVRAQGELAAASTSSRAFFAEGLCSSYEAFHHTRDARGDSRDVDDNGVERKQKTNRVDKTKSLVPLEWYEKQVEALIPSLDDAQDRRYNHPKMRPVVERAVDLWANGEKVLVFCFYRQTAKALLAHLKERTERRIMELAAKKLGLKNASKEDIKQSLTRISRRLSEDGIFRESLSGFLGRMIDDPEYELLQPRRNELLEMLLAYVRSPAFLSRFVPLDLPEVRAAFRENQRDEAILRKGAEALINAIETIVDGSNTTTRAGVEQFLDFAKELADRSQVDNTGDDEERGSLLEQYLAAVAVYSSPHQSHLDDDADARSTADEGSYRVLPVVRMVYGDTKADVRQRLMAAFNSPLFPEILVSSAVLAEGVDLHRFCRHVIHHDLCWNPSTLEQRTGRVDRIRCKAEYSRQSIIVYEPFIGGSADEKMFRVVQDRERWFQIVMGQKFEFDEATSEKIADRVPLPVEIAEKLIFNLRHWESPAACEQ